MSTTSLEGTGVEGYTADYLQLGEDTADHFNTLIHSGISLVETVEKAATIGGFAFRVKKEGWQFADEYLDRYPIGYVRSDGNSLSSGLRRSGDLDDGVLYDQQAIDVLLPNGSEDDKRYIYRPWLKISQDIKGDETLSLTLSLTANSGTVLSHHGLHRGVERQPVVMVNAEGVITIQANKDQLSETMASQGYVRETGGTEELARVKYQAMRVIVGGFSRLLDAHSQAISS